MFAGIGVAAGGISQHSLPNVAEAPVIPAEVKKKKKKKKFEDPDADPT